ncbi:MAG TPA: helix-turn-helix domain-containing protein [Solirubrobacteraceae bacterium]|nr:helix-turn-helix domain-containing protein [Solirubrobacteraceae bacterium]
MTEPAYTRLDVDERRRRLLELGRELFAQHSYDELSMARIAREAGISKALLYHYFPSKQEYFAATLATAAEQLRTLTEPDPDLPPIEALGASLDAYLGWIESNQLAYTKFIQGATSHSEVRSLIDQVRDATSARIVEGIAAGRPYPGQMRAAVRAWLWFMDGACTDWVEHHDYTRDELRNLLLGTLFGALGSAGATDLLQ